MNAKKIIKLVAALATASVIGAISARAAVITWGSPAVISGDTDVSTAGTLVAAYSANAGAATVNGVSFVNGSNAAAITLFTNATYGTNFVLTVFTSHYTAFGAGTSSPFGGLSQSYRTLLSNGIYGGSISGSTLVAVPVITATNLIFGHQYNIQVWADDSRTGRATSNYADLFSPGGNDVKMYYNSTGAVGGVGMWSLGTFVADGPQAFSILGNIASGMADTYLNAVQIRDLGMATIGVGYWNGQTSSTLDSTSANFCANSSAAPLSLASLNSIGTNQCYFYDGYFANSVSNPVTANNITVTAGGFSIGTINFLNSALTYTLTSADANGISGSTELYKSGPGTLILDGPNTYSGGTILSLGTVQVGNADVNSGTLGSGPVNNGASLVFDRNDNPIFANVISGGGTVTQAGTGTLTLTGVNTYPGKTFINAGNLTIGGAGQLNSGSYDGTISIASGSTFDYNSSANQTITGAISGSGALSQTGASTLVLTAANTYSGGTTIGNGSTLQINNGSGTGGSAGASAGGITMNGNGALIVNVGNSTMSYPVTGGANNTITINMSTGNLWITNGNPSQQLENFNGTIIVNGGEVNGNQLVVGSGSGVVEGISANATWVITNGAIVDFNGSQINPAPVYIYGMPTASGTLGALRLDASQQTGNVYLMGNTTIGNGNATASLISGNIIGNYGFTMVGTHPLYLSGNNTYTGATVISNSTLLLTGAASIANSSGVAINGGTTFDVSGVNAGTYYLGASQTLSTLGGAATINGNLDVSAGSPISIQFNTGSTAPLTVTSGALNLNNNPITVTITGVPTFTTGQILLVSGVTGTVASSPLTVNVPNGSYTPAGAPSLALIGNSLYLTTSQPIIASYLPYTYTNIYLFDGAIEGVPPTFSVNAVSGAALSYQWYIAGRARGTNGPAFTPSQAQVANFGPGAEAISCIISSSDGVATNNWVLNAVSTNTYAPYPLAVLQSTNASGVNVPPVAYWRLDESDMGAGNTGRPVNDWIGGDMGAYTNVNLGLGGYSAALDPTETSADFGVYNTTAGDSTATIPLYSNIDFATGGSTVNFSVECWVNAAQASVKSYGTLVSQGIYSDNDSFVLAINSGGNSTDRYYRFYVGGVGHSVSTATSSTTANGTWQHLVGVCNESAGKVSIYINGVSVASSSISATAGLDNNGAPIIIGYETGTPSGDGQWVGLIDDVAIYNYALPASQIAAHYAAKGTPPTVSLIASTNVDYGAPLTIGPTTELGTPPLTNTWLDSNANTVVSTSETLTIASATTDKYILTVSNGFSPPATTNTVSVNAIQGAPSFASPGDNITPTSETLYVGTSCTFSLLAFGTYPLSYQWYNANGMIFGATNSFFTTNATLGTNMYYCVVNNGIAPAATSGSATLVGVSAPIDQYARTIISNGPIAYWRLNEAPDNGSGNYGTIAYDYVGGHNAAYNGVELDQPGVSLTDSNTGALFGMYANPNSYAGEINNSSFGIAPIDLVANSPEFTIEAWVKSSTSQASGAGIVAKGYGTDVQFALTSTNDYFCFYFYESVSATLVTAQSTTALDNDGLWHHIVGVADTIGEVSGNGAHLYIDGADNADGYGQAGKGLADPGSSSAQDLVSIGARAAGNTSALADQFVGNIAEVAIYNYAFSSTNVAADYAAGTNSPQFAQIPAVTITHASSVPGTSLTLTWTSLPGYTYQVQASPTLSPVQWSNLGNPIPATGTSTSYTDTSTNVTQGLGAYYQVIGFGYYPGY